MATNYLLGKAERLMKTIPHPGGGGDKTHPYTFSLAKQRLLSKLPDFAGAIAKMPDAACPRGQTVSLVTFHPSYLAKTYYPTRFLGETGLKSIGSRQRLIVPEAPSPKRTKGEVETALEIFVAGPKENFSRLEAWIKSLTAQSPAASDIRKIEDIRLQDTKSKVRTAPYDPTPQSWEAVLRVLMMKL